MHSYTRHTRARDARSRRDALNDDSVAFAPSSKARVAMAFRRRATKSSSANRTRDGDAQRDGDDATPATTAARARKKASSARALLSFEDDAPRDDDEDDGGGGGDARAAKATRRRGVAAMDARRGTTTTTTRETRAYDAAALAALRREQATLRDRPEARGGAAASGTAGRSASDVFGGTSAEAWMPPPPARETAGGVETVIPDAKTIAEAKAKREAARAKSTAADYVDLDSSGGRRERVAFKSVRDGGARDRYAGYVEGDILPGSDDDEFERAQLQRVFRDEPEMRRSARDARATMERAGTGVSIERGGMEAFESLKRALEAAESSSETARREATRADENAVKSQEALAFYEKELKDASERYVFTQKLRDYFRDACAMLHEKKLILDELEEHYRKFHAERAQALTQAMNAEFEESAIEAEAAAEAVNAVLQRSGSQTEAKATAVTAIRDAVFNAKGLHGEKLDDMGRDLNIAMREKVKARSKRRESSDTAMAVAEDEREVGLFHKDWADARDAASSMLKDASEEFSTLSAVKRHAEEWKRTHLGSYKSTYMSVSVPNLFAPFVRLELIGWSPLFPLAGKTAPGALDAMSWYGQLFDYGVIDGKIDEGDEDANLLPNMVQHVVLPIASEAVEEWWEPRDPAQSRALASTLKDIFVYVEPSANEEAKEIVIALQRRLKRCAEECAVPTYSPIVATCAPNAARHAQAQFRLALDLVRSAFAFEDIVDRAALQRIVADGIIGAQVIPYVRLQLVDPAACAASLQAVVDVLPADWLRAAPPAVAPARDIIRALKQSIAHNDRVESSAIEAIEAIAKSFRV